MPFPPKVVSQTGDGRWAPYDCWVATTRGLIEFASNGQVHLSYKKVRQRAGKWIPKASHDELVANGAGNIPDIIRVLRHEDTAADFRAVGLRPPKVRNLGTSNPAMVSTYLLNGYQVAGAIFYGKFREKAPNNTGSNGFDDNHSVRWYGAFDANGKRKTDTSKPFFTDQLDPLCDGRPLPDGDVAKKGAQRIRRNAFVAAAGAVDFHKNGVPTGNTVGLGNILALAVGPARKKDGSVDDKNDGETPLAIATAKIADLEDTLDSISDAFASVEPLDDIRQILEGTAFAPDPKGGFETDDDAVVEAADGPDDEAADKAKPVNDGD